MTAVARRNLALFDVGPIGSASARDYAIDAIEHAPAVPPAKPKKRNRRKVKVAPRSVHAQLGEAGFVRGHRIGWAARKLELGYAVARKGWDLEERPKRLRLMLEGEREHQWLVLYTEARKVPFPELTWADVSECDWYLVEQLELVR